MTDVSSNTSTTAIIEDGVYRGQFEYENDTDWIAVELTSGVTYTVKALGVDSDNGSAQYIAIDNIRNASADGVDFTPIPYYEDALSSLRQAGDSYTTTEGFVEITPSTSGTYYLEVDGWGFDLGSYTVFVTQDQRGGEANESLSGTSAADSLMGGRGEDTLVGGDGDDYLDGEWDDDLLTGGDGADTFRFYSDDWDDINDGVADLWGNDTVTDFDPSEDTLHFAGRIVRDFNDFTVTESGGNTTLTTYWGDSVTLLNVSADDLSDASIRYRQDVRIFGSDQEGGDGNDTLNGDDGDNIIYGRGGDDVLTGGDGHDYLRGFEGDDRIEGGDDIDVIGGEDGNDTLSGGAGNDYIVGNDGDDILHGDGGNDLLESGNGNDNLSGGAGADTLRPGIGDDTMAGGNGADVFVIGRSWGDDRITDFSISTDTLDFQGSGLDIEDITVSASGSNTVLSDGTNTLTLVGVDTNSFNASIDDLILEAGSITSHYTEFSEAEGIADPTDEILTTTGILGDSNDRWVPDDDGITRVSYSFIDDDWQVVTDDNSEWWFSAGEPITPYAQYLVEQEIARIESYTNLDMVWVDDTDESAGNIRMGYHQFVIGGGSTTPYAGPYASDVWVGINVGEDFISGFFIHEMGHSLGMVDLPDWNEYTGQDYTIMSYVRSARYEDAEHASVDTETFQSADIAALQYLYGADTETTAGNDTFTYDLSEGLLYALYDAGGRDTIQVTGTGDAVHIDLTPGAWSNIGPDIVYSAGDGFEASETGTLRIMPNTVIENARGSSGNDTLTGNTADNVLVGFGGDDMVSAAAGNDSIWAGGGDTGDDTLMGQSGNDVIAGGLGDDLIIGGQDGDVGYGGSGDDTLVAADWSDGTASVDETAANALWAGEGQDALHGASGVDQLGGGTGNDTIYGNDGDDIIYSGKTGDDIARGGGGNDIVFGGSGNDSVSGGSGSDELYGGSGNDIVEGGEGTDTVYGGAGNDLIIGGAGDDILFPGGGNDTLEFEADHGDDRVSGFSLTDDFLDLSATSTDFAVLGDIELAASEATLDDRDGLLLDTGDGNSIFLVGLSMNDLSALQVIY